MASRHSGKLANDVLPVEMRALLVQFIIFHRQIHEERKPDVHIGRLRKALCLHGGNDLLRTVRGAGYALG